MNWKSVITAGALSTLVASGFLMAPATQAAPAKKAPARKAAAKKPAKKPVANANLVPLKISLPRPAFTGTPKNIPPGTTVERPTGKPRPAFLVPRGTTNLSFKKTVTSSDMNPIIGTLDLVTDGDKEATDGSWVELGPGTQWVQIDLGKSANIHAVLLWHYHGEARVYRDVVVQVSDDSDFITGVKTIYNNDQDNSSGQGIGKDREFFEVAEGRLIRGHGAKGRYVRLYSRGNTSDDQNHYTEVEVFGK
jgi:hypothetical protein